MAFSSYWYNQQYEAAKNRIKRWTRRYAVVNTDTGYINLDTVHMFVTDALNETRSPGRRRGYQEWLDDHQCQVCHRYSSVNGDKMCVDCTEQVTFTSSLDGVLRQLFEALAGNEPPNVETDLSR